MSEPAPPKRPFASRRSGTGRPSRKWSFNDGRADLAIERKAVFWRRVGLVLLVLLAVSYGGYATRPFPHGGSPWGILYGLIGTALILVLLAFGIRKRAYRSTWGTMEGWLQAHIYLGIFTLFVILAHTGGRFHDRVAVSAFALLALVVLSGLLGAVLYLTVPRLLTDVESNLTPNEISEKLNQLNKAMARIASGKSEQFQRVYDKLVDQAIPASFAGWRLLVGGAKQGKGVSPELPGLLGKVPAAEQDDLRQLMVFSRQHQELHLRLVQRQRYKNVLDSWLYIHVPLSLALVVLVIAHLVGVFYYGKLNFLAR